MLTASETLDPDDVVWQKQEMLFIHEETDFLVQVDEQEDLIFWELVDTRYIGQSKEEIVAAQLQEIHPTEDTFIIQNGNYAHIYRRFMKISVLGSRHGDLLKALLAA